MRGALSYNEQKVRKGVAELVLASGFSCDINQLGFTEKLRRFEQLTQRNDRIKTNTLHLSLNFPPEEEITPEKMQRIVVDYMDRIGFGGQPYLAYRHDDSNHPHIHIVTTNIQKNGKPISFHNLGKDRSEPARKSLEIEYGLIPAENRKKAVAELPDSNALQAAEYGSKETKEVISQIVQYVTGNYKYSSLDELNGILKQFNVIADPGPEGSFINQKGGLQYSILDKQGFKKGVAIKASEITGRPTLKSLERRYEPNKVKKVASKKYTEKSVLSAFNKSTDEFDFIKRLQGNSIKVTVNKDSTGKPETVQFVDHFNKTVFTSDELNLSLATILSKFTPSTPKVKQLKEKPVKAINRSKTYSVADKMMNIVFHSSPGGFIQSLFAGNISQYADFGPIPIKKKKKRKRPPL